jgi:hypothetical protein
VYVFAPLADKVLQNPGQIAVGVATGVMVGRGLTTTRTVLVLAHPAELPVTV